jgi:glycosyltransferase involved in cell wall biosynthesis
MNLKYIYWFAYFNDNEPSVRYRAVYPLAALREEHGIDYTIVYPGYGLRNAINFGRAFVSALFARKTGSLIVFQKIHTRRLYSTLLKLLLFFRRSNTLYDTDDADYLRFPANNIYYFMRKCSACSVGSTALAVYVSQYNSNVFLLTSPVIAHGKVKSVRSPVPSVGWIGYYNAHQLNLHTLVFEAIRNLDFQMKFVILGVTKQEHYNQIMQYFASKRNIQLHIPMNIDWHNEAGVYELIKTFDIGIAPLVDNEFNRAKSAFKLKQCLSCGVPVLASSVGENLKFLQHDDNGYFCDTSVSYRQRIEELCKLPAVEYDCLSRNALASASRFTIELYNNELKSIAQKIM